MTKLRTRMLASLALAFAGLFAASVADAANTVLNKVVTVAACASAQTLAGDDTTGTDKAYSITATGSCPLTLSAAATGRLQTVTAILRQDATGGRAYTLPLAAWPNGSAPTLNLLPGYYDVLQFTTPDGSAWLGSALSLAAQSPSVPNAPTIIATAGNAQNAIAVTDGAANGSSIITRQEYRGTTSGAEALIGNVTLSTGVFTDTGLTNGQAYFYKFGETNGVGSSLFSAEATATPVAAATHYVSVAAGSAATQAISTPVTAANAPTSFADLKVQMSIAAYPSGSAYIAGYSGATSTGGFILYMNADGTLEVNANTASGVAFYPTKSSAPVPSALLGTTFWARMIFNTSGATVSGWGDHTCTYQYSTDGSTWTTLSYASNFNGSTMGTGTVGGLLGIAQYQSSTGITGKIYQMSLMNAAGVVLANPNFTVQTSGVGSFADTAATPNTWTITAPAVEN